MFLGQKSIEKINKTDTPEYLDIHDRRYLPRWKVENRILYRKNNEVIYHESQTQNLNCDGVCFTSQEGIDTLEELYLTIYLADDIAIHLKGKVLWEKVNEEGISVGVHFSGMTSKAQDLLLEYAFEKKKTEIRKHWFEGW